MASDKRISAPLNIDSNRDFIPIYQLHHEMIKDLHYNGHVVHGLFADCLAMANSKTEGRAYTKKWQEIADGIRNLPALQAKILNVKQEEDGEAETPAHLLRLLKPAIPPHPAPSAMATYDPDEMFQLWLALRERGELEQFHRRTKGKHLGPIIPTTRMTSATLIPSLDANTATSKTVLLFFILKKYKQDQVGGDRRRAVQPLNVDAHLKGMLLGWRPRLTSFGRGACVGPGTKLKYKQADIAPRKRFTYTSLNKLNDKAAAQKGVAP